MQEQACVCDNYLFSESEVVFISESGLWLTERRGQLWRRLTRLGVWNPVWKKKEGLLVFGLATFVFAL